ncbi:trehalose-6-phosphate synthase phosphatase [Raphidocelis subcapitata]|uniref:Trehalose-6-phosphate synthase phosphatase n=1 Tax=Raphidocelis subcapitata TaxID=307507 RepID=A0A2V0NJJ8_9CHLO|nr:trehalose-6-phosphate synthase phosphatase [Raphidocelis subcapitata]|eukprot:GBF87394.1 trehalose-6-phosphate synthase phosphatase [Raphidocelis subcapitata]
MGLVWHYRDADPAFGNWQAKELTDHLEDVLSNLPVEVTVGSAIVEIKPQGVTKGCVVEAILERAAAEAEAAAAAEEGAEGEGEGEVAGREGQEAGAAGAAGREGAGGAAGASNGAAAAAAEAAAARAAERRRRVRFAEAPEFVLCVGDDRSDEDMFAALEQHGDARRDECKVFACVVGQKPSRAPLYLNDHYEVLALLAKFGDVQLPPRAESFTA